MLPPHKDGVEWVGKSPELFTIVKDTGQKVKRPPADENAKVDKSQFLW